MLQRYTFSLELQEETKRIWSTKTKFTLKISRFLKRTNHSRKETQEMNLYPVEIVTFTPVKKTITYAKHSA